LDNHFKIESNFVKIAVGTTILVAANIGSIKTYQ
jgi:hypothetical protein